jgi:large subunit ribosomal protein L21
MIGGTDDVKVGTPVVSGATVSARIVKQDRSRKVMVFKFKRRQGYKKKQGHRQAYTQVEITGIES